MLAAALHRLRIEEEELEQSCGTSGPAKITPPVSAPILRMVDASAELSFSQK